MNCVQIIKQKLSVIRIHTSAFSTSASRDKILPHPNKLFVADNKKNWEATGFVVDSNNEIKFHDITIKLIDNDSSYSDYHEGTQSKGIIGWDWYGISDSLKAIDEIPIIKSATKGTCSNSKQFTEQHIQDHPNSVINIDHIVLNSYNLNKTEQELESIGLTPRRRIENTEKGFVQLFYRPNKTILEVVSSTKPSSDTTNDTINVLKSNLWGITFTTKDINATHTVLSEWTKTPHDAFQKGRKFMTLKCPHISTHIGFISQHVKIDSDP